MAGFIYTLCFVTALGCALALFVAYRRSRAPLLLWSGLCFLGLAGNEALVLVDLYVVPETSLLLLRRAIGLLSVCAMLFALILQSPRGDR